MKNKIVIMGAGPAGLSCAHHLAKNNIPTMVFEKDNVVGGLCQTLNFRGYLFDIGGHRFLSDYKEINDLWQDIMGDDMLRVKRMSRIFYRKKFFNYPLSFLDTFSKLGAIESFRCVFSYLMAMFRKTEDDSTFEGWIINRFGKRLYDIFFRTYTEKVWAIACQDISADWAKQRIKGLSLRVAIQKAIMGMQKNSPKTLCEEFYYPRTGPGEFCERLKETTKPAGTSFELNKEIVNIVHDTRDIISVKVKDLITDRIDEIPCEQLFSSIPLPFLITMLAPKVPAQIRDVSSRLKFRSILVVNIVTDKESTFPDQWIYIHSPDVKLGRIQNYKNWSPAMVSDPHKTSLGLEYFCSEGDSLWRMSDVDLIDFAMRELESTGILSRRHLINGFVVRRANVYPIYSLDYKKNVSIIRKYLDRFSNLKCMGRGGLFRYDNSDRALLSGMNAATAYLEEKNRDDNI